MKSRLTPLLTLLLLVSTVIGLPVTRAGGLRVTAAIVCELRERRVEERTAPRLAPRPQPAIRARAIEAPAEVLLDHSLFQRPPPVS